MARTGAGLRGTKGAPTPSHAPSGGGGTSGKPRHLPMKPMSAEFHQAKRGAMAAQGQRAREAHATGNKMPAVRHGGFQCGHCGHHDWREHPVVTREGATHATLAFKGCARCGAMHPAHVGVSKTDGELVDVAKMVDSSETSLQAQDHAGDVVGHRKQCPRGGDAPCGKDVKGKCSLCNAVVRDHEAIGKSIADVAADLRKQAGLS